jgi:phage-related protein
VYIFYGGFLKRNTPLTVVFYETSSGNQPVRDFLLERTKNDRKEIGSDIFEVQEGFPLGLPLVEKPRPNLWEIRSTISNGICRIFFTIFKSKMILLHGFVKKAKKTPAKELDIALKRLKEFNALQGQ